MNDWWHSKTCESLIGGEVVWKLASGRWSASIYMGDVLLGLKEKVFDVSVVLVLLLSSFVFVASSNLTSSSRSSSFPQSSSTSTTSFWFANGNKQSKHQDRRPRQCTRFIHFKINEQALVDKVTNPTQQLS